MEPDRMALLSKSASGVHSSATPHIQNDVSCHGPSMDQAVQETSKSTRSSRSSHQVSEHHDALADLLPPPPPENWLDQLEQMVWMEKMERDLEELRKLKCGNEEDAEEPDMQLDQMEKELEALSNLKCGGDELPEESEMEIATTPDSDAPIEYDIPLSASSQEEEQKEKVQDESAPAKKNVIANVSPCEEPALRNEKANLKNAEYASSFVNSAALLNISCPSSSTTSGREVPQTPQSMDISGIIKPQISSGYLPLQSSSKSARENINRLQSECLSRFINPENPEKHPSLSPMPTEKVKKKVDIVLLDSPSPPGDPMLQVKCPGSNSVTEKKRKTEAVSSEIKSINLGQQLRYHSGKDNTTEKSIRHAAASMVPQTNALPLLPNAFPNTENVIKALAECIFSLQNRTLQTNNSTAPPESKGVLKVDVPCNSNSSERRPKSRTSSLPQTSVLRKDASRNDEDIQIVKPGSKSEYLYKQGRENVKKVKVIRIPSASSSASFDMNAKMFSKSSFCNEEELKKRPLKSPKLLNEEPKEKLRSDSPYDPFKIDYNASSESDGDTMQDRGTSNSPYDPFEVVSNASSSSLDGVAQVETVASPYDPFEADCSVSPAFEGSLPETASLSTRSEGRWKTQEKSVRSQKNHHGLVSPIPNIQKYNQTSYVEKSSSSRYSDNTSQRKVNESNSSFTSKRHESYSWNSETSNCRQLPDVASGKVSLEKDVNSLARNETPLRSFQDPYVTRPTSSLCNKTVAGYYDTHALRPDKQLRSHQDPISKSVNRVTSRTVMEPKHETDSYANSEGIPRKKPLLPNPNLTYVQISNVKVERSGKMMQNAKVYIEQGQKGSKEHALGKALPIPNSNLNAEHIQKCHVERASGKVLPAQDSKTSFEHKDKSLVERCAHSSSSSDFSHRRKPLLPNPMLSSHGKSQKSSNELGASIPTDSRGSLHTRSLLPNPPINEGHNLDTDQSSTLTTNLQPDIVTSAKTEAKGIEAVTKVTVESKTPYVQEKVSCVESKPHKSLKHHKSVKNDLPYRCAECGRIYTKRDELLQHLHDHLAEITGKHPFVCPKCPGRRFPDMKQHQRHHRMGLECNICGEAFHSAIVLAEHRMRMHIDNKSFKCKACNKGYSSAEDLTRHEKRHTSHKCKVCGKKFEHKDSLKKHCRTHSSDLPSVPAKSQTSDKLLKHPQKSKNVCPSSGKEVACIEGLKDNAKDPQDASKDARSADATSPFSFRCEECGESFSDKLELKQHAAKHVPHKCHHCVFSCSSARKLVKHLRKYHKDISFGCKLCEKCFSENDKLDQHLESEQKSNVEVKEKSVSLEPSTERSKEEITF